MLRITLYVYKNKLMARKQPMGPHVYLEQENISQRKRKRGVLKGKIACPILARSMFRRGYKRILPNLQSSDTYGHSPRVSGRPEKIHVKE